MFERILICLLKCLWFYLNKINSLLQGANLFKNKYLLSYHFHEFHHRSETIGNPLFHKSLPEEFSEPLEEVVWGVDNKHVHTAP